jgi:hypothetical protein
VREMAKKKGERLEAFLNCGNHSLTLKYTMEVIKNCIASGFVMTAGIFTFKSNSSFLLIDIIGLLTVLLGFLLLCLNMIQLTFVGMKEWSTRNVNVTVAVTGGTLAAVILLYIGVSAVEIQVARF